MHKTEVTKKWMEREISLDEFKSYKQLYNNTEFNDLLKLAETTKEYSPKDAISKSEAWKKIENKLKDNDSVGLQLVKSSRKRIIYYTVAASLLILIGLSGLFLLNTSDRFETGIAENKEFTLPDGSIVTLNAKSKLTLNKANWKTNKVVALKGEAYFQVKKEGNFTVNCSNGSVKVLGTEFNIFSRDKEFMVKCTEGKVNVTTISNEQYFLTKNEAIRTTNNQNEKLIIDSEQSKAWLNGLFHFDKIELSNVFNELERQFEIKVKYKGANRLFTGYFKNKQLTEALDMICLPMALNYSIENKIVTIEDKQ